MGLVFLVILIGAVAMIAVAEAKPFERKDRK